MSLVIMCQGADRVGLMREVFLFCGLMYFSVSADDLLQVGDRLYGVLISSDGFPVSYWFLYCETVGCACKHLISEWKVLL